MIEGKKVGLRPLESQDVWLLYRWFNDSRVLEDLGAEDMYFCVSMEEEKMVVESITHDHTKQFFIVQLLGSNTPIGIIGLAYINGWTASAELRLVIGEVEHWGMGYGEDAVQILLDNAFKVRNMHRVWLRVAAYNQKAIALYKKCGFVDEGRLRQDHFHKGQWQDALRMSILEEEFRGR